MTQTIKIPLRSLNETVIRDLQEKYPEAEISVDLNQDHLKSPLSNARFWEIIDLLDWEKEGDDDAVLAPALERLAQEPVRHIFEFADLLSEKLYLLDGIVYAKHIGEDAWSPDRYFSVDNFLYARCCVIANGKNAFEQVLQNPDMMPKDFTFEALLYLPSTAYTRKTNAKYAYTPAFPIETYSNEKGWSADA
jgi:hypothetical protein